MTAAAPIPAGLPGLEQQWSRTVVVADTAGTEHRWHVLDNGPELAARGEDVVGTLVCVHGNPTWSYLWRRVIAQAPPGWRVVAPDHLGMGFSDRTRLRRLGQRVDDLDQVLTALDVTGRTALLAHDWGGPIGLGWAIRHRAGSGQDGPAVEALALTNTAVHQPSHTHAPVLIQVANSRRLIDSVCRRSPVFVRAATAVSRHMLPADVKDAFAAPYRSSDARTAVRDFVADIPLRGDHPSSLMLDAIAAGLTEFDATPSLLVWGLADPVFSPRYLEDLQRRLPHADVQRYPDASHLVLEDRPEAVGVIWQWLEQAWQSGPSSRGAEQGGAPAPDTSLSGTEQNAAGESNADQTDAPGVPIVVDESDPLRTAIVELHGEGRQITAGELAVRVRHVAAALAAKGVRPGDRVAVLVPPGIDLSTVVYALWQLGAVVVVADAGLGLRRLGGALRGARPQHIIAINGGLALARMARVSGQKIRFDAGAVNELVAQGARSARADLPSAQDHDPDEDAAILFTSGATGPPKGVVYTRRRLAAQVALLRDTFHLRPGGSFVAAFAPFALYGPALGLTSAVPDMDVTAPHTLTADTLAAAVERVDAQVLFASPAALRAVVASAPQLPPARRAVLSQLTLVLSAGAPVPVELLHRLKDLMPSARTETPYGMTEALPVASIDPTTASRSGQDPTGVCVGTPLTGVQARIHPLDADDAELHCDAGVVGEIVVTGPHIKDRYDGMWATQQASAQPPGWHRTGDVGEFDRQGRLWVQGRIAHLIHTADGPVPPYGIEQTIERLPDVEAAAAVGVGPEGTQQVVIVVVPRSRLPRLQGTPLAPPDLAARVRAAVDLPVAAVLQKDWLPVDIRHASKVDRTAVAQWATRWLHGRAAARELRARTGRAPTTKSR